MRTLIFLPLLFCASVFAQQCSTANPMNLVSEQTINVFSCPTRGISSTPKVTITDNYAISCSYAKGNSNFPGTYFSDTTTVTGNGECLGANTDPTQIRCNPIMSTQIIKATSPTDVNKFLNKALDRTIATDKSCFFGNDHADIHQCGGQPCDAGGGGGTNPGNPCLTGPPAFVPGPTGQVTSTGGGGGGTDPTCSPVIIDTEGEGFHLTSAANGVMFDISGDGHPIRIAWTAPGSHNAFLALDRDGSGTITSGKELFGNFTAQPKSDHPNGFLALAEFDKPENGGNGDGIIDEHDAVYSQLRLWIDENHDGIAQPNELHKLPELGVYSLALHYSDSRKEDQFGNEFRYKARVNPVGHDKRDESSEAGRNAYDVFFVTK